VNDFSVSNFNADLRSMGQAYATDMINSGVHPRRWRRRPDAAGGAAVVDHHLFAQPASPVADHASDDVVAARRKRVETKAYDNF
jgi:hypothetical protein